MNRNKWPKVLPPLTPSENLINDNFLRHWHEVLASRRLYSYIEKFNHGYSISHAPSNFLRSLEIGAGLGEHLDYETLNAEQKKNYVALELRENMATKIRSRHPDVVTVVGDCQASLPFEDGYFDRILAIHVLEHLPNLPAAIKEMYRLCNKTQGIFSVVIPCEGGFAYSVARRISAQREFEKTYKLSYKKFIKREHINVPSEILTELDPYFTIQHRSFFPLFVPTINLNLCIGLTLKPREKICT